MRNDFNTGLGLTIASIQRMESKKDGVLYTSALKKLVNMKPEALQKFLGKVQTLFGRLKRVVSNISLEATPSFKVCDFFKIESEGGIFASVDNDFFDLLDNQVKNSSAKELACYEFTEDITEENIIGDAKAGGIYEEIDSAHVKQICERHIVKGEKLLKENGFSNLFWVRKQNGTLCKVFVWLSGNRWYVNVQNFYAPYMWHAGCRSFFRN